MICILNTKVYHSYLEIAMGTQLQHRSTEGSTIQRKDNASCQKALVKPCIMSVNIPICLLNLEMVLLDHMEYRQDWPDIDPLNTKTPSCHFEVLVQIPHPVCSQHYTLNHVWNDSLHLSKKSTKIINTACCNTHTSFMYSPCLIYKEIINHNWLGHISILGWVTTNKNKNNDMINLSITFCLSVNVSTYILNDPKEKVQVSGPMFHSGWKINLRIMILHQSWSDIEGIINDET